MTVSPDVQRKLAAFCRGVGNGILDNIVWSQSAHLLYESIWTALKDDMINAALEGDLDRLNGLVRQATGRGFYSESVRSYAPLPGASRGTTGARWWTCPVGRCAGYGRVKPTDSPPVCAASGEALVSQALQ